MAGGDLGQQEAQSPRLFGRDQELGDIGAAFERIRSGGHALAVFGDPGVGKTALLARAADDARRRGLTVLSVRGTEEEAHLPFAALQRLLNPILDRAGGLSPGHRKALLGALGAVGADAAPDRFFVALAALELIADVGARTPVVLVVDDLSWVDSASRDVISFIARRIEAEPAVLLMASRPAPGLSPSDEPGITWLWLEGLAPDAARALLRTRSPWLSPVQERRVLDAAAGNPLALLELPLALGRAADGRASRPGAAMPLTTRLEQSFAARVRDLDPATGAVLLVAALQDSDILAETFATATDLADGAGPGASAAGTPSAAIDAAAAAGLLHITGGSFRFRHPLVRSAIAQAATPAQRAQVHEAFARTLSADPDRAVWHRALAATAPDEDLASAVDAGADRAVRHGAPGLAQEWLERAAELSVDERRRGHRLLRAAELAFELGRHESVNDLLAQVRELELDPPDYARLAGLEGVFDDGIPGDETNVLRLVSAAGRAHGAGEDELAAYLLLGAAMPCYWGAAEEPLIARVRAATQAVGLPAADPRIMMLSALTGPFTAGALLTGQLTEWSRQDTSDPALASALGRAAFVAGDFDHGLAFASQACEGLRQQGRVALLTQALVLCTFSALYLGRWDVTLVSADEAQRFAAETRQPVWEACARLGQGNVAGLRGHYDLARSLSAEVERAALAAGNRALLNGVQLVRGFAALGASRPDEAYAEFARMMDRADRAYQSPQWAWAADYFADAAALSGQSEQAAAVLRQLEELTVGTTAPGVLRALALAHAILAADDVAVADIAEARFARARELARTAPPWYQARLDLSYGSWLLRLRRLGDARGALRSAHATFEALGARAWAARASQALAESGEHAQLGARYAWAKLSSQELQVAVLAAEGLSNREIGARLFLSHRTVGSHLNRIFPRLGVHSRAELRDVLADRPPDAAPPAAGPSDPG